MAFNPRYIVAQDVIDETISKVPYNLVSSLPSPDSVAYDTEGNTILSWITMPEGFLLLSPLNTGTVVTQVYLDPLDPLHWITAMGNYVGNSNAGGYKVILNNVGADPFVGGEDYIINFTEDPNSISLRQLQNKIMQAEAKVEVDLNPVYITPFTYHFDNVDYPYHQVPVQYLEYTQQADQYIRSLIITKAVTYLLRLGFGKEKGGNGGQDYIKNYETQYKELVSLFLRARTGNLLTFPLHGLKLNEDNLQLPFVPIPRVYNDNLSAVTFAKNRINNPGASVYLPWRIPRRLN